MKKTLLIVMVIMSVLLGMTTSKQANAQVYLYYDPFEVADPDIEPMEEEGPQILLTDSQTIWAAAIMFAVLAVGTLRFLRIRKNKQKRAIMEHERMIGRTSVRGAFAAVILLLLLAGPIRAQVFLDEKTREEYSLRASNPEKELPVNPKLPPAKSRYAPLGSGILMLSALGGAYLVGKRNKNQRKR